MAGYSNPYVTTHSFTVSLSKLQVQGTAAASTFVIKPYPKVGGGILKDVHLCLHEAFTNTTTTGTTITVGSAAGGSSYLATWTPVAANTSTTALTTYRASDTKVTSVAGVQKDVVISASSNTGVYVTFAQGTGGSATSGAATCSVIIEWS